MTRERILLALGICITVIYFINLIVLGALYPEYSHMSNWVSDLGRAEAPHHRIFNSVVLFTGILFLLSGLGFFYSINRITKRKVLATFICGFVAAFGINFFIAAIFPLPDPRHSAIGIGFLTFFTPILLAWTFWKISDSRAFAINQASSFIFIVLSTIVASVFSNEMYSGLLQRIQAVVIFGWLAYSCFWLMQYKKV